jgi:hypothetical protein
VERRIVAGLLAFDDSHYRERPIGGRTEANATSGMPCGCSVPSTGPLALALDCAHLCVGGQLDTGDYRVQFLFPILRVWAHPSSTLPVSYTVEEARRHMGISERSPPRVKTSSRNPLVLLCRT